MYDPGRDLALRYPEWRVIRRPLHGAYGVMIYSRRLIIVDSLAPQVEWDCTVAHEIVHLDRGDRCTLGNPIVDERREAAVRRETARRMIDPDRLRALDLFGRRPAEVAEELGVDLDTARAWVPTPYDVLIINGRLRAQDWGAA